MYVEGSGYGCRWLATRFSDVTSKNHQTLVTITSARAEILKEILEKETAEPDRAICLPHFFLCCSTDYTLSHWFPRQISTWSLCLPKALEPQGHLPFLDHSEQYFIKNNRLYTKKYYYLQQIQYHKIVHDLFRIQWVTFTVYLILLVLKPVTILCCFQKQQTSCSGRFVWP
jgi:hypothetical protein